MQKLHTLYKILQFLVASQARCCYFGSVTSERRPRSTGKLGQYLRTCEREFILKTLKSNKGHNSRTAKALGISRRALYDKMREYGLDGEASAWRAEAGIMGPRKVDFE